MPVSIFSILLYLHIICGGLALLSGLIAIVAQKGKRNHRFSGKVFFFSMLFVSISAIIIALIKPNQFLIHVAIFSGYLNYCGYQSIKNKSLYPSILDWILLLIAAINCAYMVASFQIVLIVFGAISAFIIYGDIATYIAAFRNKEISKTQFLLRHIGMMLGAYIATSTAFIVVNVQSFQPAFLPWLLPTAIGTPLIIYWTRKYQPKKNNKK